MTHSNIKWDKLDDFIEQSKDKVNDFKRLEEIEKEKKVSDEMITRTFNEISFGITDLKIEDILKALPREICIYQEDKDKELKGSDK